MRLYNIKVETTLLLELYVVYTVLFFMHIYVLKVNYIHLSYNSFKNIY